MSQLARLLLIVVGVLPAATAGPVAGTAPDPTGHRPLVQEHFDDAELGKRGWYDLSRIRISGQQPFRGPGSIEYRWKTGGTTSETTGTIRRLFPASDSVYLSCYLRLSRGWGWSGRAYHPHFIQFLTTENGAFHGPAGSRLTLYLEPWNGRLRLAASDIQNRDAPDGLTQGPLRGGFNGRFWDSSEALLSGGDRWYRLECFFKLNSLDLKADRPNADGEARAWVDGRLVVDRKDLVFRTTDYPRMRLNQLLLAPYFGPGLLPQAQTLWVDELTVAARRP